MKRKVFAVRGGKLVTGTPEPIVAAPAAPVEPPKPKKKKRKPQPSGLGIEGLLAKIQRLDERRIAMPHGRTRTNLAKKIRLTRRKLREDQALVEQARKLQQRQEARLNSPLSGEWL